MHCELAVPGLFAAAPQARLPALELLLARGRASRAAPSTLEQWLAEAFGLDQPAPAGALTALAAGLAPGSELWARADPVHLRLMRDHLVLVPQAAFGLADEEARTFCDALNRHFSGVLELHALGEGRWVARLDEAIRVEARSALEMAGRDVNPGSGRDAAAGRLHAIVNEAQMVLHAHAQNEAREARGEPAVNSVWLWGGGRLPPKPAARWQAVTARDPVALGLARLSGAREAAPRPSAAEWLERAPDDGRHLVVLDALRTPLALSQSEDYRAAMEGLERAWFAPLLAALRAGRVGMVSIHVPDAGAAFETVRGDLRIFWRRPRPLERYA